VSDSVTYAGVGFRTSTATYIILYLITPSYLEGADQSNLEWELRRLFQHFLKPMVEARGKMSRRSPGRL